MLTSCARFWNDDRGSLIATEYLFVATILVIGSIVGLANLREAIVTELTELGNALLALSQGYTISGTSGAMGSFDGSMAIDTPDVLIDTTKTSPAIPSLIDTAVCN